MTIDDQPQKPIKMGQKVLAGTFWSYAAFISGKAMVFISTVILAYFLSQEEYGVAGYALVTIAFLDVLSDLGIGSALIYHRDSPAARDTAFWIGLGISAVLFVGTWLIAPLIGLWFKDPRAIDVTRVLALNFPLSALGNIHDSLMSKELQFKRKFIPEFGRSISKGLISIILAAIGFGPWSLIFGQLGGTLVSVVIFWIVLDWRPKFKFEHDLVRPFLSYGSNMVAVDIIAAIRNNSDYLLVGRALGTAALGIYTFAFRVPDLIIMQFVSIISRVIFPVFSQIRDDIQAFKKSFIATTRYVSMITVPIGLGLALVARPFVLVLFTDKWIDAVPVIQAISIYAMLQSLSYNAGDIYKAQGRPSVLVTIQLVELPFVISLLAWASFGAGTITMVGWAQVTIALLSGILRLTVASRMISTPFWEIIAALRPAAVGGVIMTMAVLAGMALTAGAIPLIQLVLNIVVGAVTYGGALYLFNRAELKKIIDILKRVTNRNNNKVAELVQ